MNSEFTYFLGYRKKNGWSCLTPYIISINFFCFSPGRYSRVELEARYRKGEPLTRREKLLMSIRSNVAASGGDAQEFLIRASDLLKEGFSGGKPSVSHNTFGIYHEHNPIQ